MDLKKMSKHTGKACALTASALLAAGCMSVAIPTQALAIDETRTFTWADGTQQPEIPQTITGADGREYRLTNQGAPSQINAPQTTSQQFSRTETGRINADQLGQVGSIMPASVRVDEGGYSGDIPRTGIDTTPVYRTDNDRITGTQDGYGQTQDAARASLPATINRNGRTLTLDAGSVSFSEARKDSAGNVTLWKATGTYAVDVPRQVLDHYDVVAHYSGTLSRTVNGGDWQIQAVYSADDVVPEEEPKPEEENTEDENQNPDDNINMMPPEDMDGNVIDTSNTNLMTDTTPMPIDEAQEEEHSLPLIPIAVGAGVVVVGGIVAGLLVARRKKNRTTEGTMPVAGVVAGEGVMGSPMGAGAVAGTAVVMPVIIEDPQCQLIELIPYEVEDGDGTTHIDYKQTPKADLDIEPSVAEGIPTIIYFPSMEDADGNKIDFEPVEGAQYWIAIDEDTVQQVPSKEIIVASDDDREIYRGMLIDVDGDLTDQMMLDTERMVAAVNGGEGADTRDISEELEGYDVAAEQLIASAAAVASAPASEPDPFGDGDIEEFDFEDEDISDDFVSSLDSLADDDEDEFEKEDIEFGDEELAGIFEGSEAEDPFEDEEIESDGDADPFAAYGLATDNEDEEKSSEDNFDSEFEKEMDDYSFDFGLADPDVDEFEYPEDFQNTTVSSDEMDSDDDEGTVLGSELEDINFDDMDDNTFDDVIDIEDDEMEIIGEDDVELVEDDEVVEPEVVLENEDDENDADDEDGNKKDIKDFKDLLNSI